MLGLLSILSLFATNLINSIIEARMLDSIKSYDRISLKSPFCVKMLRFRHIYATLLQPSIYNVTQICNPLVVY